MLKLQVDTCINYLQMNLDRKSMEECKKFIDSKREKRHYHTMKCQMRKFEKLQKLSQNQGGCSKQYHDQTINQTNQKQRKTSLISILTMRETIRKIIRETKIKNGYITSLVPP